MAKRPLLIGVLVVVLVAAGVFLWRSRAARPVAGEGGTFNVSNVPVKSPELLVDVGSVRWTNHSGYTDWACKVECREENGCHAEVQLVLDYVASGRNRSLTLGGRIDAEFGQTVRIGRAQRSPDVVERVDGVRLEVLSVTRVGDPTPTPIE